MQTNLHMKGKEYTKANSEAETKAPQINIKCNTILKYWYTHNSVFESKLWLFLRSEHWEILDPEVPHLYNKEIACHHQWHSLLLRYMSCSMWKLLSHQPTSRSAPGPDERIKCNL